MVAEYAPGCVLEARGAFATSLGLIRFIWAAPQEPPPAAPATPAVPPTAPAAAQPATDSEALSAAADSAGAAGEVTAAAEGPPSGFDTATGSGAAAQEAPARGDAAALDAAQSRSTGQGLLSERAAAAAAVPAPAALQGQQLFGDDRALWTIICTLLVVLIAMLVRKVSSIDAL